MAVVKAVVSSPPRPRAGAVEPLVKLVEAATDAQRRAADGSGFQVEVVQHLLTMQMQHPQLRFAIQQVSMSLMGAQMRRGGCLVRILLDCMLPVLSVCFDPQRQLPAPSSPGVHGFGFPWAQPFTQFC